VTVIPLIAPGTVGIGPLAGATGMIGPSGPKAGI